jgi:cytochrome c
VKRHYGISTRRYKLIHFYHDIDEWELYDLETDPREMNSVYGQADYANVQAGLEQQLTVLRQSYGDSDELTHSLLKSDLVSAFESQPANTLTEDEEAEGFRLLFDGETTTGWRGYGSAEFPARWAVEDGMLMMAAGAESQQDLVSEESFENFELRLQWKISKAGNSGIMFNVVDSAANNTPWKTGPEFQILDDLGHSDAVEMHLAGDLYDLLSSKYRMSRPAGEWNESRIQVNNGHLRHWLNGILVIETEMWTEEWDALVAGSKFAEMPGFGRARSGLIALQDHGDPVWFRSIRIREF